RHQRPALLLAAVQIPLAFERLEVIVHPVGRPNVHLLADFANGRREPPRLGLAHDELENLLLPVGELVHGSSLHPKKTRSLQTFSDPMVTERPCRVNYFGLAALALLAASCHAT